MPRGDRSGPMGAGPMTGRGLGYCAGHAAPGYTTSEVGPGRGAGGRGGGRGAGGCGGGGRGFRHRYYATGVPGWGRAAYPQAYGPPAGYAPPVALTPRDEAAALKAEAEYLTAALEETKSRLTELGSDKDE